LRSPHAPLATVPPVQYRYAEATQRVGHRARVEDGVGQAAARAVAVADDERDARLVRARRICARHEADEQSDAQKEMSHGSSSDGGNGSGVGRSTGDAEDSTGARANGQAARPRKLSQAPVSTRKPSTARLKARAGSQSCRRAPTAKPASATALNASETASRRASSRPYHATAASWTTLTTMKVTATARTKSYLSRPSATK